MGTRSIRASVPMTLTLKGRTQRAQFSGVSHIRTLVPFDQQRSNSAR